VRKKHTSTRGVLRSGSTRGVNSGTFFSKYTSFLKKEKKNAHGTASFINSPARSRLSTRDVDFSTFFRGMAGLIWRISIIFLVEFQALKVEITYKTRLFVMSSNP
jgi:hypothetical protein